MMAPGTVNKKRGDMKQGQLWGMAAGLGWKDPVGQGGYWPREQRGAARGPRTFRKGGRGQAPEALSGREDREN